MPEDDAPYWDKRYQQGNTGWDMGQVSPPLQAYFDQLATKDLSILIPGCGNSYEAAYLMEKGFSNLTLLDISVVLMHRLESTFPQASVAPRLITADFFDHRGQYDLIIEQTFFCALDPARRPDYVEQTFRLLRPGGKLAGLLFDRNFAGGPPFGGHKEEYIQLLGRKLTIKTLAPCYNSIPPRAGSELFFIAEKPQHSL